MTIINPMELSPSQHQSQNTASKTTSTEDETRSWSDLPPELLSPIADKLGLIELLGFRGTCKDWLSASSTATAQIECSPPRHPWFLLYGDKSSQCSLYNPTEKKKYTVDVPELKGSNCLASSLGWLLLFREGSIFFFCPFSRARIDLPPFPYSLVSNHIAAVSGPPSSKDSVVCVMSRQDQFKIELNILSRGDKAWTKIDYVCPDQKLGVVTGATFQKGCFYFLDTKNKALTYSVDNKKWTMYRIVVDTKKETSSSSDCLPFAYSMSYIKSHDMRSHLDIQDDVTVFTCGTCLRGENYDLVINNEVVQADEYEGDEEEEQEEEEEEESDGRLLKGIWIQPRFLQITPNQSWAL